MDHLSINIFTWNVATIQPPPNKLVNLFEAQTDLIAVGLQEVKSQPFNRALDAYYGDSWTNSIRDVLVQNDYVKVYSIRLVGILLSFFCKRIHLTSIRNIETSYTRTGMKGYWGNKGAVSMRFNFNGSSMCFVNTHLTPHDNNLEKRIDDYYSIINGQTFQSEKINSILDHDFVFWFGDLNFRLDGKSFTSKEIISLVDQNKTSDLLAVDELKQILSENTAFSGFSECQLNFKPTYKFIPNTSEKYDEKRRPGWTDRIIYREFDESPEDHDQVKCKSYRSHPDMNFSDHLPVSALFDVQVKGGNVPNVVFDLIEPWSIEGSGKISYTVPSCIEPLSTHWIAFYQDKFGSLDEYVTWMWAPVQHLANLPNTFEVNVPKGTLRNPGRYLAAFMSPKAPYSILGISLAFEVNDIDV